MAGKKELSQADVDKFVTSYAKKHEISDAEAKRRIMATGVSRLTALSKYQGPAKPRKAAAKPKAAKKAGKPKAKKKGGEGESQA